MSHLHVNLSLPLHKSKVLQEYMYFKKEYSGTDGAVYRVEDYCLIPLFRFCMSCTTTAVILVVNKRRD